MKKTMLKKALDCLRVEVKPKMTWSVKGFSGVVAIIAFIAGLFRAYKGDYKGAAYCGVGAFGAGVTYKNLDNRDRKAQKDEYHHDETMEKIKHRKDSCPSVKDKETDMKDEYVASPIDFFKPVEDPNSKDSYNICGSIRAGQTVLIFGSTGCGKTIISNQFGISCQEGTECNLFGEPFKCKKQDVFIFDAELSKDDLDKRGYANRVKRAQYFTNVKPEDFYSQINKIVDEMQEDTTIILDNVTVGIPDLTGYNSQKAAGEIHKCKKLAMEKGLFLTFMFVSHTAFDNFRLDIKGYNTLIDISDLIYCIQPTDLSHRKATKMMKSRYGELEQFARLLEIDESDYLHFNFVREADPKVVLQPKGALDIVLEDDENADSELSDGIDTEDEEYAVIDKIIKENGYIKPDLARDILSTMLDLLQNAPMTTNEIEKSIANTFGISIPTVRKHKSQLIKYGLIEDGRCQSKKSIAVILNKS